MESQNVLNQKKITSGSSNENTTENDYISDSEYNIIPKIMADGTSTSENTVIVTQSKTETNVPKNQNTKFNHINESTSTSKKHKIFDTPSRVDTR